MIVLCDGDVVEGSQPSLIGQVVKGVVLFPGDFNDFQGLVDFLEICVAIRVDGRVSSEFEMSVRDALGRCQGI